MRLKTFFADTARVFALAGLLFVGHAHAATEPTMNEIYATAQSGKLEQAQVMVQQVLISHPNSAKAHFVQSELFARQGNWAHAQESLTSAEKLAPGLPFAKAEAVQALRSQIAANTSKTAVAKSANVTGYSAPAAPSSGSWLLPALLAGGVITAAYFIFRRKVPQPIEPAPQYAGGLSGPQTFGAPSMQPAYGQAPGSGLGGKIMGGVATGLAVGAGVVAAEAIGRSLMGNHDSAPHSNPGDNYSNNFEPIAGNSDMGGQNFGVTDTSWDDAGSADTGGSDWDN